eukprot:GHVT01017571.1.p1 GENE.GHVT01017571.1~~GHVT01017571.1.p1  ORF type:complete len:120 (-),score=4.10 GHVT01017571.1:243-602(-)
MQLGCTKPLISNAQPPSSYFFLGKSSGRRPASTHVEQLGFKFRPRATSFNDSLRSLSTYFWKEESDRLAARYLPNSYAALVTDWIVRLCVLQSRSLCHNGLRYRVRGDLVGDVCRCYCG